VTLLAKKYLQLVYEHCFFWLRDVSQAKTIAEQTFLKVPEALLEYKEGKLEVLLLKIATELCDAQRPVMWPMKWSADKEGQEQTNKLSESDRVILYLRRQELKWKEIASILGISEVAARKRGTRALYRLAADTKSVHTETRNYV